MGYDRLDATFGKLGNKVKVCFTLECSEFAACGASSHHPQESATALHVDGALALVEHDGGDDCSREALSGDVHVGALGCGNVAGLELHCPSIAKSCQQVFLQSMSNDSMRFIGGSSRASPLRCPWVQGCVPLGAGVCALGCRGVCPWVQGCARCSYYI